MKTSLARSRQVGAPRCRTRAQSGIMLIECLVYIGCLFIVLGAATTVFYQVLDYSRSLRRNADDIAKVLKAGERWRADVRAATGQLSLEEGAGGRALRIPQAGGPVSYLFVTNAIVRCVEKTERCEVVVAAAKACQFVREPRKQVTAWRWELELPSRLKAVRVHPVFTFSAVAPGEVKP